MAGRRKRNARRSKKKAAGGKDRFEDLPNHVLEHLLSFLPSQEAVQTCLLAKRWRHIWKSVPSLRTFTDKFDYWEETNSFVNKLIELRDPAVPLHVCELVHCDDIESWLHYAAACQVQVLQVENPDPDIHARLSNNSVISEHLKTLKLYLVAFEFRQDHSLDLSRCQALEVLDIDNCQINLGVISSKSLRHLSIQDSHLCPDNIRTRISAPGLVTCQLSDCTGLTPLFGNLPSLITAFIRIMSQYVENCLPSSTEYCEGFCCQDEYSVLLDGLSGATNLELLCDSGAMSVEIFSKDLRWRPMFCKLKTVFLNDWCVNDNCRGLVYFLRHSPILELLTLQLSPFLESSIEMVDSEIPREQFLVSKHLKVVEIKYSKVKKILICQIVKLLGTLGVTRETVNIDDDSIYWESFSFEQKKYTKKLP